MSEHDDSRATSAPRGPWNKGKLIGPKPPLQPKHVWSVRTRLQLDGRLREAMEHGVAQPSILVVYNDDFRRLVISK